MMRKKMMTKKKITKMEVMMGAANQLMTTKSNNQK